MPALLAAEITVKIESPLEVPTFGGVAVVATVDQTGLREGDAIEKVTFFVDGKELAIVTSPPFEIETDVGQENREHEFRVEAVTAFGERVSASRTTPTIRIDMEITLELQQLYVTVMASGQRVRDLGEENFRILDDGAEQKIVTFEGGDAPLAAALLLDTSASMEGPPLDAALAGSRAFVAGMSELDRVSVFLFADRLRKRTSWSGDPSRLEAAMDGLEAKGSTAIWDVLFRAIENLDARQGRRVAVLLSDGIDLHSALGMDEVLWKLRRSSIALYWLRLEGTGSPRFRTLWRDENENGRQIELLEEAVELSGGRILQIATVEEVEPAFAELLSELRDQYVIGYYPSTRSHDGSWHDVRIRVRGRGSVARSRTGYVDE